MRLRARIVSLAAVAVIAVGVTACAPAAGKTVPGPRQTGRDRPDAPARHALQPQSQPVRQPGDPGDRRARRGEGQGRGAGRRGHRPDPVGSRPGYRTADGERHQGDDGPAGAARRQPRAGNPDTEGGVRLRLEVRRRNRVAAPGGPAHRAAAAGGAAAALGGGRGVYPRERLRSRDDCLRRADERDRGPDGHDAHPLHLAGRAALPHRDRDLLHAVGPAHPRPGGDAVPGLPVDRGPARSTTCRRGAGTTSTGGTTPTG